MELDINHLNETLAHLNANDVLGAIDALQQRLGASPADTAQLVGIISLQFQRYENASRCFEVALQRAGDHPQLHLQAAIADEQRGAFFAAQAHIERAIALGANSAELQRTKIRLLGRQGRILDALKVAEESVQQYPSDVTFQIEIEKLLKAFDEQIYRKSHRNFFPLLLVGHGHAAGSYIAAELARRLGMKMRLDTFDVGPPYSSHLRLEVLEEFITRGGVIHTHMFPLDYSLTALKCSGLKQLLILVRDPRQAIYSIAVWNEELKKRANEPGISKYDFPLLLNVIGKDYFNWSFEQRVDHMIETELPLLVRWIEGWLAFANDASSGISTKLLRFEDFKTDYTTFFNSILDFYKIDHSQWHGDVLVCQPGKDGRPGAHAIRKGSFDEWRRECTSRQQTRIAELVPRKLIESLGYPE